MGVQQLFACGLGKVTDRALGDPILEMGVDATEGELLAACLARLFERVVCELSIIAVIMFNFYAVLACKLLKRLFGLEGLFRQQVQHEMDESHARVMIDEDDGAHVSPLGKFSLELRKETNL